MERDAIAPELNRLLGALPEPELGQMRADLSLVWCASGRVLHEPDAALHYVWFPTTAIVSLLQIMPDGKSSEVAMIGNEGMVGIPVFTGGESMSSRAVVVVPGYAYRLPRLSFKRLCGRAGGRRRGALNGLLLRYSQALIGHFAQTAICNRHHAVAEQLCSLLLMARDRAFTDELPLTHELIASLIGVRRTGITEAARDLRAAGLIAYRHGRITLLRRAALEACACDCHAVVRRQYEHLLPGPASAGGDAVAYAGGQTDGAPRITLNAKSAVGPATRS